MGNTPSIGRRCLPKPTSETLLAALPFEWGPAVHANCYEVVMPDDWLLRNSSTRRDLIDLEIIDPDSNVVARVTGKNTDYDFRVRIDEVKNTKIDLREVSVHNGYIYDTEAKLTAALRKYRMYCTSVNGYPHLQEECDQKYAEVKAMYEKEGKKIPIEAIQLSASKEEGLAVASSGTTL